MMVRHSGSRLREKWNEDAKWRFKGHAEQPFWRWVCSWARSIRKPSDMGFDDAEFILPPLTERQHLVETKSLPSGAVVRVAGGRPFRATGRTPPHHCGAMRKAASLVAHDRPAVVWCHLNDEGDLLESLIPDCVQISGKDDEAEKEAKFLSFIDGQSRVMVY